MATRQYCLVQQKLRGQRRGAKPTADAAPGCESHPETRRGQRMTRPSCDTVNIDRGPGAATAAATAANEYDSSYATSAAPRHLTPAVVNKQRLSLACDLAMGGGLLAQR